MGSDKAQLVPATRLDLPLLDPQVARELGIVAANLLDEALGVLAANERLDGVAERVVGARAGVDDRVDESERRTLTDSRSAA